LKVGLSSSLRVIGVLSSRAVDGPSSLFSKEALRGSRLCNLVLVGAVSAGAVVAASATAAGSAGVKAVGLGRPLPLSAGVNAVLSKAAEASKVPEPGVDAAEKFAVAGGGWLSREVETKADLDVVFGRLLFFAGGFVADFFA